MNAHVDSIVASRRDLALMKRDKVQPRVCFALPFPHFTSHLKNVSKRMTLLLTPEVAVTATFGRAFKMISELRDGPPAENTS